MEVWTIRDPFDTILVKHWPVGFFERLIGALTGCQLQPEIAEALCPIKSNKRDYYKDGIVKTILIDFYKAKSLCDANKQCQDVIHHSVGMKCVTAAAIRKRLHSRFPQFLGVLENSDFQTELIRSLNISPTRQKFGILLIHCNRSENNVFGRNNSTYAETPSVSSYSASVENSIEVVKEPNKKSKCISRSSDSSTECNLLSNCTSNNGANNLISTAVQQSPIPNALYNHTIRILYDNFYLFTAPLSNRYPNANPDHIRTFIGNQIFRNSDCIVILVDEGMISAWNSEGNTGDLILKSLGWDIRLRILVIGVCLSSRDVVNYICDSLHKRPWPIFYEQLILAPSGGLISLIERACKLDFKDSFMKYCYRANVVIRGLNSVDSQ